ncbi:hypothetical protein [Paraburkholderia guartelaensis]|uniref:Uncharacterized protein n=1 Tax=Paraburkholderia guartelaensis TaxID=2546446 RepID=A0ABU9SFW5_9BURK
MILRADGRIAAIAEAIEPEQAALFADELEVLALRLRRHSRQTDRRRQRGAGNLDFLISLAFAAATYINTYPLVDAALSIGAQIVAAIRATRQR